MIDAERTALLPAYPQNGSWVNQQQTYTRRKFLLLLLADRRRQQREMKKGEKEAA